MTTLSPWKLNYGWGQRQDWQVSSDVCLEARIEASDADGIAAAIDDWIGAHQPATFNLDGRTINGAVAGGVSLYAEKGGATDMPSVLSVFLHSRGEDAFDSLAYHAKELTDLLNRGGGVSSLTSIDLNWIEHDHRRGGRHLIWRD